MKHIKIIFMGMLMATVLTNVIGCNTIDNFEIDAIEDALSEEYGKSFTVAALGNRFNEDTATAYVFAEDDPTIRFIVRTNTINEIIFENYAYRTVCHKVEKKINDTFSKYGLKSECFVEFSKCLFDISIDTSVENYIEKSKSDIVKAAVIIHSDEKITGENLEKIFMQIYSEIPEISVGFSIYILSDRDYENVYSEIITETQYFGIEDLRTYGIEDEVTDFYVEITNGTISETIEMINFKLRGEGK